MSRVPLVVLGALALGSTSLAQTAQSPLRGTARRVQSPAKYAGTYHVATRTFVRGTATVANLGTTDAIYAATADVPYFTAVEPGEQLQDTGVIPGPTNPLATGAQEFNRVTSFDFAYCELDASLATTRFEVDFFESASPCTTLAGVAPTASVVLDGLPAAGQCWVVNVDLAGGAEFCIESDGGDGSYDFDLDADSFGWAVRYTGGGTDPVTGGSSAGPILGADPSSTDFAYSNPNGPSAMPQAPAPPSIDGTGTYYNPLSNCLSAFTPSGVAEPAGSGLLNQDFYFVADLAGGGANSGCYYLDGYFNAAPGCGAGSTFSGRPFCAVYLELNAEPDCPSDTGCQICIPTVCSNVATDNTSGQSGEMVFVGTPAVSANNLTLRAAQLPAGVFGIFLHGLTDISSSPIAAGNGFLCVGEAGRFGAPGQIRQADANGVAELSTNTGAFSISALPIAQAPFTVAAASGTTSYFAFWHRDFTAPASAGLIWQ